MATGQHLLNNAYQQVRLTGLHHEPGRTDFQGQGLILGAGIGGSIKNKRNPAQPRLVLDPAAQLKAIHYRHENIAENQLVLPVSQRLKRLGTVGRQISLQPVPFEQGLKQVLIFLVIVNAENAHGQPAAPSWPGVQNCRISAAKVSGLIGFSIYPEAPAARICSRSPTMA